MQETLKTHTEAYAYFMHTPLSLNENDQIYCHMVVKKNIAYTELLKVSSSFFPHKKEKKSAFWI